MESQDFRIASGSGRSFSITIDEVDELSDELIRTLLDIDLQTFSVSTFTGYTARVFMLQGRVFLLKADQVIIGACVCMRSWERPHEVTVLSMGIRPGWRGRGLGQRFVAGMLARLKQKGLRSVTLLVGRDNRRAVRVYEDTGFEAVQEIEPDGRSGEAFVFMRAHLQDMAPVAALPGPA